MCYLSCDKPELVKQSLPVLVNDALAGKYHLFVADGSRTEIGAKTVWETGYPTAFIHANIGGGAGAAIVYALSWMLDHEENYDVVGLCENDVLLAADWYDRTAALFERGAADGLPVGAVSARAYVDRVLCQRDGYAVCHNLGAGHILLTREAAEIVLRTFRTAWTSDNRRIFAELAGIDIGLTWAFRLAEHYLTADWGWDAALAAHGLASLALTPSPCDMIGQNPPLHGQGLVIVRDPVEQIDNTAFERYRDSLQAIRDGRLNLNVNTQFHYDPVQGTRTYFPHQMHMLGGTYGGGWCLKEARGWGTFAWVASEWQYTQLGLVPGEGLVTNHQRATLSVPIFGPCAVLVSGGKDGGKVEVSDLASGYKAEPELPSEGDQGSVLQLQIPGGMSHRTIRLTALTPGIVFYGIQTREPQPFDPSVSFNYNHLPPA